MDSTQRPATAVQTLHHHQLLRQQAFTLDRVRQLEKTLAESAAAAAARHDAVEAEQANLREQIEAHESCQAAIEALTLMVGTHEKGNSVAGGRPGRASEQRRPLEMRADEIEETLAKVIDFHRAIEVHLDEQIVDFIGTRVEVVMIALQDPERDAHATTFIIDRLNEAYDTLQSLLLDLKFAVLGEGANMDTEAVKMSVRAGNVARLRRRGRNTVETEESGQQYDQQESDAARSHITEETDVSNDSDERADQDRPNEEQATDVEHMQDAQEAPRPEQDSPPAYIPHHTNPRVIKALKRAQAKEKGKKSMFSRNSTKKSANLDALAQLNARTSVHRVPPSPPRQRVTRGQAKRMKQEANLAGENEQPKPTTTLKSFRRKVASLFSPRHSSPLPSDRRNTEQTRGVKRTVNDAADSASTPQPWKRRVIEQPQDRKKLLMFHQNFSRARREDFDLPE